MDLVSTNLSLLEDKNRGKFVFISYNIFHRNCIFVCFIRLEKKTGWITERVKQMHRFKLRIDAGKNFSKGWKQQWDLDQELLDLAYKVLFGQYNAKAKCFHATFLGRVWTIGFHALKGNSKQRLLSEPPPVTGPRAAITQPQACVSVVRCWIPPSP